MIDWISRNKEWIFSGVGVATIALLWRFIKAIRLRGTAIPPFDQAVFRTRPLPREIAARVNTSPLLHQPARTLEFVGLKTQWKTALQAAREIPDGRIRLLLLDRGKYPCVFCNVPKDRYPDLLLAEKGTVVWVAGRISEYSDNTFEIEEAELRIVLP